MKKNKLKKISAYNYVRPRGQKFVMPSETVQGETLTVSQLFERASIQGHFPLNESEAKYVDVDNLDEITSMYRQGHDIVDIKAFGEHLLQLNKKIEAEVAKQEKERKSALKEAEKQAIIKEHLESVAKEGEKKIEKN